MRTCGEIKEAPHLLVCVTAWCPYFDVVDPSVPVAGIQLGVNGGQPTRLRSLRRARGGPVAWVRGCVWCSGRHQENAHSVNVLRLLLPRTRPRRRIVLFGATGSRRGGRGPP